MLLLSLSIPLLVKQARRSCILLIMKVLTLDVMLKLRFHECEIFLSVEVVVLKSVKLIAI